VTPTYTSAICSFKDMDGGHMGLPCSDDASSDTKTTHISTAFSLRPQHDKQHPGECPLYCPGLGKSYRTSIKHHRRERRCPFLHSFPHFPQLSSERKLFFAGGKSEEGWGACPWRQSSRHDLPDQHTRKTWTTQRQRRRPSPCSHKAR
jgi:hypothetical protein